MKKPQKTTLIDFQTLTEKFYPQLGWIKANEFCHRFITQAWLIEKLLRKSRTK